MAEATIIPFPEMPNDQITDADVSDVAAMFRVAENVCAQLRAGEISGLVVIASHVSGGVTSSIALTRVARFSEIIAKLKAIGCERVK